jgi:hypothetical protein
LSQISQNATSRARVEVEVLNIFYPFYVLYFFIFIYTISLHTICDLSSLFGNKVITDFLEVFYKELKSYTQPVDNFRKNLIICQDDTPCFSKDLLGKQFITK